MGPKSESLVPRESQDCQEQLGLVCLTAFDFGNRSCSRKLHHERWATCVSARISETLLVLSKLIT